ncbi:TetR/AcrR family transcriptional regulator [Nocardioides pacificus]
MTVEALSELGYARTTTAEISRRSGISQGGLFRHFPTRPALIVAAADEVRARQFDGFRAGLARLGEVTVAECLRLLREACRAPVNAAWYELLVAARTDTELRAELAPMVARYHEEILALGRSLPIADVIPEAEVDSVLLGVVHLLDGEALTAVLCPHPEQEDQRLEHLVRVLAGQPAWGRP